MGRLSGKIAIVTGAGQGIGKATTNAFVEEGAFVIAVDKNPVTLEHLKGVPNVRTYALDVTDVGAVKTFASTVQDLDILFNCAGYVHHGTIFDCDEAAFDFSVNLNVKSIYVLTQHLLPLMIKKEKGSIINMSSVCSSIKGAPNRFIYGTTKAALIGMTKSIASDFIDKGIRCNAICPGTVDTESFRDRVHVAGDPEKAYRDFVSRQKMGRLGTVDEIAKLCVYLASDESSYTTGTEHVIDGGWSI